MKRIAILAASTLSVLMMTEVTFAVPRFTVIHMTKNHDKMKYPGVDCIGIVTTETLPSKQGEDVTWFIRNGNAFNSDDVCPGLDKSKVSLHFEDAVMGAANMVIDAMGSGNMYTIKGTIDMSVPDDSRHKYTVWYMGVKAGPDPEVDVACADCGGGGH